MGRVKLIVIIVASLLLMAAAVCLIPMPQTVTLTFQGAQLSEDGTILQHCHIRVEYTRYNYLILNDTYKNLKVSVGDFHYERADFTAENVTSRPYTRFSFTTSDAEKVDICPSFENDRCFIRITGMDGTRFFAGSSDGNLSAVFDEVHAACNPLPVSQQFCGAKVTADGTILEECNISLSYTKLDYLFKEDTYRDITLDVAGMGFDTQMYNGDIPSSGGSFLPYERLSLLCYNAHINGFGDTVDICFSFDGDWCFVRVKTAHEDEYQYFVGSTDGSADPQEILTTCAMLVQ